ncbi:hypothetical protein PTSG_02387 [Salpingoeca rosetta]|uniref:CRAL-TRIO domain-containing protein n=1 Tax=Salpingoeca rosetta (strain ATCC 50818 / BSB-021) TaxID=946362 RepID=F2U221_SALR5|nr:uncharacterized protein PTSG_02387 [Salpingoeca rosetta]EGD81673.1 hypothetical protein PTSG_02387 [Salpingoeca rosetta]|eukprot:XP_004996877.1 hypothetical protein PTSG_02387 [Salpingoeca rosetta]
MASFLRRQSSSSSTASQVGKDPDIDKVLDKSPRTSKDLISGFSRVARSVDFEVADGQLVYPLNSEAEKVKFREFQELGKGDALFEKAGPFWQLACLRARKFDMQRSLQLVRNYMVWREEYGIEEYTMHSDPELKAAIECGGVRACGNKDKQGRYVLTIRLCLTDPKRWPPRYAVRTVHSAIEMVLRNHPESQARGIVFVNDMTGAKMSNADSRVPRELFSAFANKLPLRFGCVYAVNPPLFMRFVWPIVRHFMSRKMQSRMKLLPGGYPQLRQHFTEDQILQENGGTFPYDHDEYVASIASMQARYGQPEENTLPEYLSSAAQPRDGEEVTLTGARDADATSITSATPTSTALPSPVLQQQHHFPSSSSSSSTTTTTTTSTSTTASATRAAVSARASRTRSQRLADGDGAAETEEERRKRHARQNSIGTLVFV